jgi:hypothetical protein
MHLLMWILPSARAFPPLISRQNSPHRHLLASVPKAFSLDCPAKARDQCPRFPASRKSTRYRSEPSRWIDLPASSILLCVYGCTRCCHPDHKPWSCGRPGFPSVRCGILLFARAVVRRRLRNFPLPTRRSSHPGSA